MTENSPLFGSRADTLRSASATWRDASALQNTTYCNNLSFAAAAIRRISAEFL